MLVAREGLRVGKHGGKQVDGDLAVSEEGYVFRSRDIAEGNVDGGPDKSDWRSPCKGKDKRTRRGEQQNECLNALR